MDYASRRTWDPLVFGTASPSAVQRAVADPSWQRLRRSLLGQPLETKFDALHAFLNAAPGDSLRQVCVTNYVHALSRGGLIK
jgi:hypothetical protein